MPCSIGHSWWHMEQHPIQHSLYHGKVPARLLLPAKTIHLTASLWADCVVFAWLMWYNQYTFDKPQCCIINQNQCWHPFKKPGPDWGSEANEYFIYTLSTTEEKRQKGRTHTQCQDPSHTWSVWHRWEWFFFERTHFSMHIHGSVRQNISGV